MTIRPQNKQVAESQNARMADIATGANNAYVLLPTASNNAFVHTFTIRDSLQDVALMRPVASGFVEDLRVSPLL